MLPARSAPRPMRRRASGTGPGGLLRAGAAVPDPVYVLELGDTLGGGWEILTWKQARFRLSGRSPV